MVSSGISVKVRKAADLSLLDTDWQITSFKWETGLHFQKELSLNEFLISGVVFRIYFLILGCCQMYCQINVCSTS